MPTDAHQRLHALEAEVDFLRAVVKAHGIEPPSFASADLGKPGALEAIEAAMSAPTYAQLRGEVEELRKRVTGMEKHGHPALDPGDRCARLPDGSWRVDRASGSRVHLYPDDVEAWCCAYCGSSDLSFSRELEDYGDGARMHDYCGACGKVVRSNREWHALEREHASALAELEHLRCVRVALGYDRPWPAHEVIQELVRAADVLLDRHGYDGDGWEEMHAARDSGCRILADLDKLADRMDKPARDWTTHLANAPEEPDGPLLASVGRRTENTDGD